ncbi:MAG: CSLREA domain-containing protein [Acidobacteriota bacterium]|nr:CSLREA domain-containing protein [Acidobacteriota bacterium]
MKYAKKLFVTSFITICACLFLVVPSAQAVTFTVTKTADTDDGVCAAGDCSLREAIFAANDLSGPDTIEFKASVFGAPNPVQQIILSVNLPELSIEDDLTIFGPGPKQLLINGNADDRVFSISSGKTVSIRDLSIINGKTPPPDLGGDITSIIKSYGGGILNLGNLTLSRVRMALNHSGSYGGAIKNNGTLTILYSVINNNVGSHAGGGISNNGLLKIANTTITDNKAYGIGGGIHDDGGSDTNLNNVTISHNTATGDGGGIKTSYNPVGVVRLRNTIVSNNTGDAGDDVHGNFTSQGSNLIRVNTGSSFAAGNPNATGDYVGTSAAPLDPKLGPLQDNGGITSTRALLPGSPAIDKGDDCVTWAANCVENKPPAPLVYDQRFTGFNRNAGASVDIGAFEAEPTVSVSDVSLPEGNQNTTSFNFTVNLSGSTGQTVTVSYQTTGINASAGVDFVSTSGALTFAPGETSKTVTVPVLGDTTPETNEQFHLNLSAPVNATLADAQGVGTIQDDDNHGLLVFKYAPYSGTEGNSVLVTVERLYGTMGVVTVQYSTFANTATAGADYTAVSGILTFANGETIKTFTINLLDDQTGEPTEDFNVFLANPTGGATLGVPSNTTVSIQDNDQSSTVSISGIVSYANNPLNQQQKYIPKAMLSAVGDTAVTVPTDSSGAYLLEYLTSGSPYTVTATKVDDINGITAFDATLVLRHVAAGGQGANALSLVQQKAADSDGDSVISAFDATQILRYVAANGSNTNTGQVGKWKFQPATKNYQSLGNSLSGENYEGILIGEVNGDWMPPGNSLTDENENLIQGETAEAAVKEAEAEISLPGDAFAESGEEIIIPILFANSSGKSISSYSFDIAFDPTVLQLDTEMPFDTNDTLSQQFMVAHDAEQAGRIGIAASGNILNDQVPASGVLLKLRFQTVKGGYGLKKRTTNLTFQQLPIFEDEFGSAIAIKTSNGSVGFTGRKAFE